MNTHKRVVFIVSLVVFSMAFVAPAATPTWAPAYGLRNKTQQYLYRYYPTTEVYFDTTRNLYFYEVDGKWTQAATLSADIQRRLKDFVTIAMDTQIPYEIHQEIAAVYSDTAKIVQFPRQEPPDSDTIPVSETARIVEVPRPEPPAQPPEEQLATYHYRYYPDADVYLDSARKLYFYQIAAQWFQAPTLPPEIDQRLTEFVQFTLTTDNPAIFNKAVVQIYPPFQSASRQYLYYPDANVYFDPDRELYFYSTNDQWVKAPTLLESLRGRLTEFVTLNLKTDTPYELQDAIGILYPSAQVVQVIEREQPPQPEQPVQQDQDVTYVYYYDQSVYFDPARAMYFYLMDGAWQHAPTLPDSITIVKRFVNIKLNTLKPYAYHQIVLKKYPPGQAKKMGDPEKGKESKPKKDNNDQEKDNTPHKDKNH